MVFKKFIKNGAFILENLLNCDLLSNWFIFKLDTNANFRQTKMLL